jgi:uncharacterized membrane protein YdjX (TVP38/TMEM64 family)
MSVVDDELGFAGQGAVRAERQLVWLRCLGLFVGLVLLAGAAAGFRFFFGDFSLESFERLIRAASWEGQLLFVAVFCVATLVFVPSTPMAVVAAVVFGPLVSFIVLQIATMLAAALSFVLVRLWLVPLLGLDNLRRLVPARLRRRLGGNALLLIVYGRTLKLPAPAINYGSAALPISFADYQLGVLLGSLPNNLAVAMLCGVAKDAILARHWAALLQWELLPAVGLTVFNLVLAHRLNGGIVAGHD